ncbi:unnamed protein product [Ixodes hexagonus]
MSQINFVGNCPGVWSGAPVKIASDQRLNRVRPCSSCAAVESEMVELPCSHVLCRKCQWEEQTPGQASFCPRDGRRFANNQLRYFRTPASEALRVPATCPNDMNGCTFMGELRSLPSHLSSPCRFESPNAVAPGRQACSCSLRGMCPNCSHQPASGQKTADAALRQEPLGEERPREFASDVMENLKVQLQSMGRRAHDRPRSANAQLSSDPLDTYERAKKIICWRQFPLSLRQRVLSYAIPAMTQEPQGQPEQASPQPPQQQQEAGENYDERLRRGALERAEPQLVDLVSVTSRNSSESISTITQVLHQLRSMPGNRRR